MLLDAPEDLGAVHLAEHDVLSTHGSDGVGHSPAIAVEHRQRVEVYVAVVHAGLPSEHGCVQPEVPVRHLDAFRTGRRAAGVVDGGGGTLVRGPGARLDALEEQRIGLLAVQEPVLHLHVAQVGFQFGVHEQDVGARVVHDVLDLLDVQAEIDRHADTSEGAGSKQEHQHPGGVVAHHRHPGSHVEAHGVEAGCHCPGQFGGACVCQVGEGRRHLVGLVDNGDPVAVDDLGSPQVVGDGQGYLHVGPPSETCFRLSGR